MASGLLCVLSQKHYVTPLVMRMADMSDAAKEAVKSAANSVARSFQIDTTAETKFFASETKATVPALTDSRAPPDATADISDGSTFTSLFSSSGQANYRSASYGPVLLSADGSAVPLSRLQASDVNAAPPQATQLEPDTIPEKKPRRKRASQPGPAKRATKKAKASTDKATDKSKVTKKAKAKDGDAVVTTDDESDSDDEQYVVERIIEHKGAGKTRRFLIKWEGYEDEDDNTWEAERDISAELVAAYVATLPPAVPRAKPAKPAPSKPQAKPALAAKPATVQRTDGGKTTELRETATEESGCTGFFVINGEHVNILSEEGSFSLIKSGRQAGYIKSEYLGAA